MEASSRFQMESSNSKEGYVYQRSKISDEESWIKTINLDFYSSRTNKNVPGLEKDLLVDRNETRRGQLRQQVFRVSTTQSSTAETSWIATSSTNPEVEVGRHNNGLCDRVTPFQ